MSWVGVWWGGRGTCRLPPLHLLAQLLVVLHRVAVAEVRQLVERPQLDLDVLLVAERRPPLRPLDRLLLRADLDDRVAGDELLRLGERAVDDARLPGGELDER